MQSGARVLQQGGTGSTDDRGIYRIYGLQPGEYIVAATPRNASTAVEIDRMQAEVAAALEMRMTRGAAAESNAAEAEAMASRLAQLRSQLPSGEQTNAGYAPVYYPGTTLPGSAGTVAVGIGEEKQGVDFQLQLVSIARVEGVIVTSNGPMPQNVQLTLVSTGHEVPGVGNNSTRADRERPFPLQQRRSRAVHVDRPRDARRRTRRGARRAAGAAYASCNRSGTAGCRAGAVGADPSVGHDRRRGRWPRRSEPGAHAAAGHDDRRPDRVRRHDAHPCRSLADAHQRLAGQSGIGRRAGEQRQWGRRRHRTVQRERVSFPAATG